MSEKFEVTIGDRKSTIKSNVFEEIDRCYFHTGNSGMTVSLGAELTMDDGGAWMDNYSIVFSSGGGCGAFSSKFSLNGLCEPNVLKQIATLMTEWANTISANENHFARYESYGHEYEGEMRKPKKVKEKTDLLKARDHHRGWFNVHYGRLPTEAELYDFTNNLGQMTTMTRILETLFRLPAGTSTLAKIAKLARTFPDITLSKYPQHLKLELESLVHNAPEDGSVHEFDTSDLSREDIDAVFQSVKDFEVNGRHIKYSDSAVASAMTDLADAVDAHFKPEEPEDLTTIQKLREELKELRKDYYRLLRENKVRKSSKKRLPKS